MAAILDPRVVGGAPDLSVGAFAGDASGEAAVSTLDPSILGGLSAPGSDPGRIESTLNVDPNDFVTPRADTFEDIDLAQPGPSKQQKTEATRTDANEMAAAKGGLVGTGAISAVDIWSSMTSLKSEDQMFMARVQQGYEDLEFNKSLIRTSRNMNMLNGALNSIEQMNKQAENVTAGGQEQLFLRSANTGRLV